MCGTWRFWGWPSRWFLRWPPRRGPWRSRTCAVVVAGLVVGEGTAAAAAVVLGLVVALGTVEGLELGLEEGRVVVLVGVQAAEAASVVELEVA